MTEARKAARDAAKEVIEQTEINIRDLRETMRQRVWEAAYEYASETPRQYREVILKRACIKIADDTLEGLLGGQE